MLKTGTKVIFLWERTPSKDEKEIRSGTITSAGKIDAEVEPSWNPTQRIMMYTAFLYPDIPECRALLNETLELQKRHKQESEELYKKQLEFNNALVRKGLK